MKFCVELSRNHTSNVRRALGSNMSKIISWKPALYTYKNGWTFSWAGRFLNYYTKEKYRFIYASKEFRRAWMIWPRE